ncbi:MAG TPA: cupin domain-containing protein [Stellaceae bacterium]|nr:cupin domain-containing protein [Stellaceae bacterium]
MIAIDKQQITGAEVVLPSAELEATLAFFRHRLGFQLQSIFPADAPAVAVLAGHGLRLRLDRDAEGAPGHIRLLCREPDAVAGGERVLTAPNGTRIELVEAERPVNLPPIKPELVIARMGGEGAFDAGRAGMLYRDLIPGRLGGRFIASHIRIPAGGPVPDYVHFHKIRFQMIFCRVGWVRLVYEDQGPPFVMEAGDCVLQPPEIRHRVLESSPGLEVIEIACPAVHETFAENAIALPTDRVDASRDFGGQRFLWHVAAKARWQPWRVPGFECRDTGIGEATRGLAAARVVRPKGAAETPSAAHDREFQFFFVLDGAVTLACTGTHPLAAGDAVTIPAGLPYALSNCSDELSLLEVTLPA